MTLENIMNELSAIRKGGQVKRYHVERVIGENNNAEHSWNVAMLILKLCPDPSRELIRAALEHDIAEAFVGDGPGPAKRRWPDLAVALANAEKEIAFELHLQSQHALTSKEQQWLRACDSLEALLFSYEQIKMGNSYAMDFARNCWNWLNESVTTPSPVRQVARSIAEELSLIEKQVVI